MKTLFYIFLAFMYLSVDVLGQDLEILNTKDLIKISRNNGLDSTIKLTGGIPVYYIDSLVAKELVSQVVYSNPSQTIENFLVDYALHVHDNINLPKILYGYFDRKRNYIKDYRPDTFGGLSKFSEDALVALIENPTNNTDSLLIRYYNDWLEKSLFYQADYLKGKTETNSREKERLMTPYEDCNLNCYLILLALDSMNSNFFDKNKLLTHQKNLKYYLQEGFHFDKTGDFTDYKVNNVYKSIKLIGHYNTIGDIDFRNEPEVKQLFSGYSKSYCWKFIIYNDKMGYLDVGCQSAPLSGAGVFYRLELFENELILHEIELWVS